MPIYGYKCSNKKCGKDFEVFYQTTEKVKLEEPGERCPACGSKRKRKLPAQGTSFQLKGKGWYKDGY